MARLSLLLTLLLLSCEATPMKALRYIALGDSYTIGTGAPSDKAWPVLLTRHLGEAGVPVALVANPARNGFNTQNLIEEELPVLGTSAADFVTLLIGVNDWVQGVDATTYRARLVFILDHLQSQLANKDHVLLITIPDFSVTPEGGNYANGRDISRGIAEFNGIIKAEALARGLPCADLFTLSKGMKDNPALVAEDGLHPSAEEYALWEKVIFAEAMKVLKP